MSAMSKLSRQFLCAFCTGVSFGVCFLLWGLTWVVEKSLHDVFNGKPVPVFTDWLFDFRFALFLVPVPWLVVCVWFFFRKEISTDATMAFSTTLAFVLIAVAVYVAVALTLPWLPLIMGSIRH
jgi:hypothetical protein